MKLNRIRLALALLAGVSPSLVWGGPTQTPSPDGVELTFKTTTRRPRLIGVPELNVVGQPPTAVPKYYRTQVFEGERHSATSRLDWVFGSEAITGIQKRSRASGTITYVYSATTDAAVRTNNAVIESATVYAESWPFHPNPDAIPDPSQTVPPNPLPFSFSLTDSTSITYDPVNGAANNPLGLPVNNPTLAKEVIPAHFLGYIGDGIRFYPNWSNASYSMELLDEDAPIDAEIRAPVTEVLVEENPLLRSSIMGSRPFANGEPRWTIRHVDVTVRFTSVCAGEYQLEFNYKKRAWTDGVGLLPNFPDRQTNRVTVTLNAGELFEKTYPLLEEANKEVVLESVKLLRPAGCGSGCSVDSANAGSGTGPTSGSIYWLLPLGRMADGRSAGSISLHRHAVSADLYSPSALDLSLPEGAAPPVKDNLGRIRQVLTAQALFDIVPTGTQSYEIRVYESSLAGVPGAGDLYTPTGSPYVVWKVENPDASGTTANTFKVTRVIGTDLLVTLVDESQSGVRVFSEANGLRITETTTSGTPNSTRVETIVVKNAAGTVSSKKVLHYQQFDWGVERVKEVLDPDGAALTTTWTFFENAAHVAYGKTLSITHPNGFVETFSYATGGGLLQHVTPAWTNSSQSTSSTVEYLDLNADGIVDRLATESTIVGLTNIRREFTVDWGRAYPNDPKKRDRYVGLGTAWNSANNLRTSEVFTPDGKLIQRLDPNGVLTVRSSTTSPINGNVTVTETIGAPNAAKTAVVDGTTTTQVYSAKGILLSTTVTDLVSGLVLDSLSTIASDALGRPTQLIHTDGALEARTYCATCNQVVSVSLRGETTNSLFDELNRQILETRLVGTTVTGKTRFEYDADGRLLRRIRIDPQTTAETVLATTTYDLAGRVAAENSLQQGPTGYTYTFGTNNSTVTTTTFADGGTRIETRAASGAVVSVAGTAVAPVSYVYSTRNFDGTGDGYLLEKRLLNSDNSYAFERQSINLLGETEWTEVATGVKSYRYFDAAGRLNREVDPDGVTTLYAYDARGRTMDTALDFNRDGIINYAGTDRINRTLFSVGVHSGRTVNVTTSQVWETDNVDAPTTIAVNETSVDGLRSWQTSRGLSSSISTTYDGTGGRTVLSIATDNTRTTQVFAGPHLISTTRAAADLSPLGSTTYTYDSLDRMETITDARNGTTTYLYDANDRLFSVTTPDPDLTRSGPGYDPQTTTYGYDVMGRVSTVTHPDTAVVNTTYYPTGAVKRTWGARTYPVEYTYDTQGRVKTLTTWQNFAGDTGRAVTTWNYDANRGWLWNKRYHDNQGPTFGYSNAGRLTNRTWARTPTVSTSYTYNNAGELATTTYSDNTPSLAVTYDRLGRPKTVTDASGLRTLAYDPTTAQLQSELYSGSGPLSGVAVNRSYNALGQPYSLASTLNTTTPLTTAVYDYDSTARLGTITSGTAVTSYVYTPNSDLIASITSANAGTTRLSATKTYDRLNRLAGIVNAYTASVAGLSHTYNYNAANQRTQATREDGAYWNYTYDALGQVSNGSKLLASGTPALGLAFGYTYDDIGNRLSSTANGQTAAYAPSLLNTYTQRTVPPFVDVAGAALSGVPVAVSAGNYAALATRQGEAFFHQVPVDNSTALQLLNVHIAAEQNPTGSALAASQLRPVLVPKSPEVPVHDADGNLVDDARWHYTWDAENRLVRIETNAQAQSAGVARTQLAFVYDGQGRRVQKTVTRYPRSGLVNVRRDYFTNTSLSGTPNTTVNGGNIDDAWFQGQGLPYSQPFSYRVTASLYVPSSGSWTLQANLAYGGARLYVNNTLVIDAWTGSGNLSATLALAAGQAYSLRYEFNLATSMPGGATPASQLNWSGPGVSSQRLPNAAGTTANPAVATTRFVYDGWNLLAELDSTGALLRSYTWGPDLSGSMQGAGGVGGLIGFTEFTTQAGQPAVHFPAFDGNGNVTGLVQAADGALSASYDYNSFGERVLTDGVAALLNPFRFSSKFQDDESGLSYYGYRYYHPQTGRWLSRDPIREEGGLNLYGFVRNNSINDIDLLGLLSVATDFVPEFATGASWKWGTNTNRNVQGWTKISGTVTCGVGLFSKLGNKLFGSSCRVECEIKLEQQIYRNTAATGAISWPETYGHEQFHIVSMLSEARKLRTALEKEPDAFSTIVDAETAAKEYTTRYKKMMNDAIAREAAHNNPGSPKAYIGRPPLNQPPYPSP